MNRTCPFCGLDVRIYEHAYYGCPVIEHTPHARYKPCVFQVLALHGMSLETAERLWNRRAADEWEDDGK